MSKLDQITFEDAKAKQETLRQVTNRASDALKAIGSGSGPFGITPDAIKFSPEYQAAKSTLDRAFKSEQRYNSQFVKQWAATIRAERRARHGGKAQP